MINNKEHKMMNGAYSAYRTHSAYGAIVYPLLFIIWSIVPAAAQDIVVGGNIYGGGNQAQVDGNTTVTVYSGNLNKVFGGARMSNVGGRTYVNVDGKNASAFTVINYLFGGNDISGTIGKDASLPTELVGNKDGVTIDWNTFVHISSKNTSENVYYTQSEIDAASEGDAAYGKTTNDIKTPAVVAADNKNIYIGQLFGGGNGDYHYTQTEGPEEGKLTHNIYMVDPEKDPSAKPIATMVTDAGETGFQVPDVDNAYVDVQGGSIVYAYGGGNNATIKKNTVIHVDNPSKVVNHILVNETTGLEANASTYATYTTNLANGINEVPSGYKELLNGDRFRYDMGINTGFSFPSSGEFQIGRFFGGNNRAEMAIRPLWNLQSGKIRNLYSGGNRGEMTSPEGLLLEIPASSRIVVDNLFGGCRMADVCPKVNGIYTPAKNLEGYSFPNELAARVLVRGGDVNNVYGGNDVTGKVYGGNAVGVYTTVRGNIYGGGNGAYPYTNDATLVDDDIYGDFYYGDGADMDDLNAFRPNAEQVSIRLKGSSPTNFAIIKGSVFVGGNCASVQPIKENSLLELKMGSYVIADKVFLGNNGEKMVDSDLLTHFKEVNSSYLTDPSVFSDYMEGVVMSYNPNIVFDSKVNGDPLDYIDNSSYVGSFYCGGNVGSMAIAGKNTYEVTRKLNIFTKFVGGCNNADVKEVFDKSGEKLCAAYQGGVIGAKNERGSRLGEYYTEGGTAEGKIKDRLDISLNNLLISPLRWNADSTSLVWNTNKWQEYAPIATGTNLAVGDEYYTKSGDVYTKQTVSGSAYTVKDGDKFYSSFQEFVPCDRDPDDTDIRVLGGNVYGGCYTSGHVNGNIVVNINEDILLRDAVFNTENLYNHEGAGISYEDQRDDVNAVALTVFGAGCGEDTEVWGSTTVNMNNGYAFQVFGGGEQGVVGKKNNDGEYEYDARYSSTVNLRGPNAGYPMDAKEQPALAEAEYIYGGGNEGDVCGDCFVNLGDGRFFDAFGGACNANIYGGVQMTVGYNGGFPWCLDNIYGGNDFGGTILGNINHTRAIAPRDAFDGEMLKSSTYVNYIQGRVDTIFGGNYGCYDYKDRVYGAYTDDDGKPLKDDKGNPIFTYPTLKENSFVHFKPADNSNNYVGIIFGGSAGFPGNLEVNNSMQREAYVLIDDTKTSDVDRFGNMDIFGAGAFAGVGIPDSLGAGRTAVDLFAGSFHSVYGGCSKEGLVGATRVNVPVSSTVKLQSIFGGGQGYTHEECEKNPKLLARTCDHYVTCVDYQSGVARVSDAIYGGNRDSRIACDTYVNIGAPVLQNDAYQATVYGGGYGKETVSGRTNVYMNNGSNVYKVFGGGRDGNVFNFASLSRWLHDQFAGAGVPEGDIPGQINGYRRFLDDFGTYLVKNPLYLPTNIGTYKNAEGNYDGTYTNDILPTEEKPMPDYHQTNVHIMNGGNVSGYAYGGGFGSDAIVSGTTYLELLGGNVDRDIYGGGQGGSVYDEYGLKTFTASTNVYIEGGMARNVYGGGYLGDVGKHTGEISTDYSTDIPAVANLTIGKVNGINFYNGIPAIQRNAYGGGEGGSVFGTTNLTINNGYIGYRYKNTAASGAPTYEYVEELDDQKPNAIEKSGNAFGGGYVVNSYVDEANVTMYGGTIRGSLYGGGEVGPIGAGTTKMSYSSSTGIENGHVRIFRPGKTLVKMYDGHVKRNVFAGGRGQDSWGGDGTLFMNEEVVKSLRANGLFCKGYVFGQTEVDIYGGEVGTDEGLALGYGNVFGGGDIGFVYSAYKLADGTLCIGKKEGTRYTTTDEGYYYKAKKNGGGYSFLDDSGTVLGVSAEKHLTEDCKVLVEPWCKATATITINGKSFAEGEYVPTSYLNYLGSKNADSNWNTLAKTNPNKDGIIIHNAVFAGGNTSPGSTEVYANTTTVFGNATASVHDVFHRDLITIGRGRVGGLYGDGNLTLVDGYREVNITNYGTDYYHITSEITKEQYDALPNREAAYYEIRYRCVSPCTDDNGKTYVSGSTITADEMQAVFRTKTYAVLEESKDDGGNTIYVEKEGASPVAMLDAQGKPLNYYWVENGVCSRYAGRPMNTVQRADFCGVFGSRMVMMGAQDRVPETVDYTNYTINRVREVSLNKKESVRSVDTSIEPSSEDYYRQRMHGNYFGIYSVVNYLGALTSDLDFGDDGSKSVIGRDVRTTDNVDINTYQAVANGKPYGQATFYDWKKQFVDEKRRNNGNSWNKVALASGVYLELTNETGTGTGLYEKDWGLITGVVELDLINVQPGMGGGYVYAKNEHGVRYPTGLTQTTLTALNEGAITRKKFKYNENKLGIELTENDKKGWQTSGNFVHSTQTIIDDCYNMGGKYGSGYAPPDGVPAHYWFIKGAIYIYDQYISAYTGSPNAFSEQVSIPLTITSASHGRLTLLDVKPSRYAYYSSNNVGGTATELGEDGKIELRDVEYQRNDAINYWDYSILAQNEKNLFVEETYITSSASQIGPEATKEIQPAGYVMLPDEYDRLYDLAVSVDITPDDKIDNPVKVVKKIIKDEDGNDVVATDSKGQPVYLPFESVFHSSNNVSHDTGYILTYNIDNPSQWNTWYTEKVDASHDPEKAHEKNQTGGDGYEDGPTYTPKTSSLYGQTDYAIGSIIDEETYKTYNDISTDYIPNYGKSPGDEGYDASKKQATFYPAYIVTAELLETTKGSGDASVSQRLHKGATLAKEDYTDSNWASMSSSVALAYVVTSTVQLSKTDFIYRGTYMTLAEKTDLYNSYYKDGEGTDAEKKIAAEIEKSIVPAYYCTEAGKYGGDYYQTGHNYRALAAFTAMSENDRAQFTFNYDALDLLIDPTYSRVEGLKYQYDGNYTTADEVKNETTGNKATYSLQTPIDYTATYKGESNLPLASNVTVTRPGSADPVSTNTIMPNDELSRTVFEALPNERQYYSSINVSDVDKTYYVVKETVVMGDTPYAAGQVISSDTYKDLSETDQEKVTQLTFTATGDYYYCHEGYTINAADYSDSNKGKVTAATGVTVTNGTSYTGSYSTDVPVGIVITQADYEKVVNKQANFAIHGLAPTETSTLYVTRNSDINDLSAEKIITAIYKYDYLESDMEGMHITPVTEYHVLNIHLNFKSGVPTVEDIQTPDIILPGTSLSMPEPYVTPGAYEITGGGWTLFDNESDAESHINGVEYVPSIDLLYLYQNKFFLSYYAKTYLGKTYSNYVPVRVANYHDLKKVFDDKENHYYIDHKDIFERLKVEPKIYINDYSKDETGSKNGLDLFKNLYDLSLLTESSDGVTDGKVTTADSPLKDHYLLDKTRVGAGKNLEFFLRTDIDHSSSSWTPIGSNDICFKGTLHGDGHTISGLDNSLFKNLCGEVYNLGVTGRFNSAGVADLDTEDGVTEKGYVESCWVKTTSTTPLGDKPYPVFGNPSRDSGYQLVNSYYSSDNAGLYNTAANDRGTAIQVPEEAFYNGEVTYDLNNFYLYKRYSDHAVLDGSPIEEYKYWKAGEDTPQTGKYLSDPSHCNAGYVESRFADGDFRYAAGTIPAEEDERHWPEEVIEEGNPVLKDRFYPIWPDDYLFFGQKLTYGYSVNYSHDNTPTTIARFNGRLSMNDDANRVYRAPAYYRSKDMNVAHFNPQVYLASMSKDGTKEAHPNMTAIDFAGHNDTKWGKGIVTEGFPVASPAFYPPLLDDDGLLSIVNQDETKNLLVYAPAASAASGYANKATFDVLTAYFTDPAYGDFYSDDLYRKVADASSATSAIYGHLVQSDLTATNDHLLVDKQDFNAPIEYSFNGSHRMWYQRKPDRYVAPKASTGTEGWEGVSLPFTAELVTTNDKGEITHFYGGSDESKNGTGSKIGHEYWLREFTNVEEKTVNDEQVAVADFLYPTAPGALKNVTNTFLWDYYYAVHNQKDANKDTYQQYYSDNRRYTDYSFLNGGTPYIIGFPGKTYYEFDLSGNFKAQNTAVPIDKLGTQTITFASETGVTIGVSDDESTGVSHSTNGASKNYAVTFTRNYMNWTPENRKYENGRYVMNNSGDAYVKLDNTHVSWITSGAQYADETAFNAAKAAAIGEMLYTDAEGTVEATWVDASTTYYQRIGETTKNDDNKVSPSLYAFRPFFTASVTSSGGAREMMPSSILFNGGYSDLNEDEPLSMLNGDLEIFARDHTIVTRSHMKVPTTVRIVNMAGIILTDYVIEPEQTVETPVQMSGVYLVNKKKIAVR